MRVVRHQHRQLLLLSNSRDGQGRFLHHVRDELAAHFAGVRTITFVPYASVIGGWDAYTTLVRETFASMNIAVESMHDAPNALAQVVNAEAIAIGGGNTFHLAAHIQRAGILSALRERVLAGAPYLGWSAGSVIACPTIQTTNDMPIAQPDTFQALGLVGFQINAHFTDVHPPGFQGETRRQRLAEFVATNRDVSVVGLPEGTWLDVRGAAVALQGAFNAPVFRYATEERVLRTGEDAGAELER